MGSKLPASNSWRAALLGAALVGASWGLSEAMAVAIGGRLWLPSPLRLLLVGAAMNAALATVGGAALAALFRRRGVNAGAFGGLATLLAVELSLLVTADPPPFQAAPWWVGSPVALGGGLALALGVAWLGARSPGRAGIFPLLFALTPLLRAGERPAAPAAPGGAGPNLLIVTLDTVRADHTSPYGHPTIETPNLERMAREGVQFDNAFAAIGATGPSHTTLMTGLGTWTHGVLLNGVPAPGDPPTLAERLLARGYRTGAFVSAYVLESKIGLNRGFSVYDDDLSGDRGTAALLPVRLFAAAYRHLYPDAILERRGGDTVDLALEWLAGGGEEPWFLWVHLFDAHGPYAPPPPWNTRYHAGDGRDPAVHTMDRVTNIAWYLERSLAGVTDLDWVIAQYDGEISYVDAQLGRLLDAVDARGEAGDTLVVVLSDHGESLGEHGVWFNHGDDLYDPTLHIPLWMRLPERLPAGARVPAVVEMTDLAPTVTELLELPPVASDGRSRVGAWSGGAASGVARSMAFDREANVRGRESGEIQRPTWRMVGLRGPDSLFVFREAAEEEFYQGSPNAHGFAALPEENGLPALMGEPGGAATLSALAGEAQRVLSAGAHGVERSGVELSEQDREKLRALGYLD